MPMLAITRAALLMFSLSLYAGAQSRTLALYAGGANGLNASAIQAAQIELQRILLPTGFEMVWKDLQLRKSSEQFDQVVVLTFDGTCSAAGTPSASRRAGKRQDVGLADSSVSNGQVLPFFRVDCEYLAQMLDSALRSMNEGERDVVFGRALARIMAHEIYHITGQTKEHQERGVAKASFSVHDLTTSRFDFDAWSLAQIRTHRSFAD